VSLNIKHLDSILPVYKKETSKKRMNVIGVLPRANNSFVFHILISNRENSKGREGQGIISFREHAGDQVYHWLQRNKRYLLPNATTEELESACFQFVYKNRKVLALNHRNCTLWEMAKDDPSDLKLIIQIPCTNPCRRRDASSSSSTTAAASASDAASDASAAAAAVIKRVEFEVDYDNCYNRIGNAYYRANQILQAIGAYLEAIRRFPFNHKSFCNLALCYLRNHEYLKCIKLLNQRIPLLLQQFEQSDNDHDDDMELITKAYFRRGRSYYALADLIHKDMRKELYSYSNNFYPIEMLNTIKNVENVKYLVEQHQKGLKQGENEYLNLVLFDYDPSVLSPLEAIRLTLLQLCMDDFARILSQFDSNYMMKFFDVSMEFDVAIWNILQSVPDKLHVCPLSRLLRTRNDKFIETSVIPSSWNMPTDSEINSKQLRFMLESIDRYGRLTRYEETFKNQILNTFCYNENIETEKSKAKEVNIDQSKASWCTFVLHWIIFKRFFVLPDGDKCLKIRTNYDLLQRCRHYLLFMLGHRQIDRLPSNLHPLYFCIYPLSRNVPVSAKFNESLLVMVSFEERFTNDNALKLFKINFGQSLIVCACLFPVLKEYKLESGVLYHAKNVLLKSHNVDFSRLPEIVLN
jgi:tetratricopeptide (TPR) repeat protein